MKHYTLSQSRYIRDLKCEVKLYRHDKTGAHIVVMPADDTNRAISIAFSTPAENDKGIPHIIEHSVLCGSKKYPLKDPFVQLMKGSMYSFLNAMTYADFTVYPVSSTNEKDFHNLMDVYLDAAFNPLMPEKKEVFLQEGRHFELDDDEASVTGFNGVVFNEMRGMEGSADFLMEDAVSSALFPGSPYACESGGLPLAIADLRYEELTDFYHRHYNASNCYIFLYGKIDEEETLDYISTGYLDKYDRAEAYHVAPIDPVNCVREASAPYPADDGKLENGWYFSWNFAVHIDHTPLNYLTLRVLDRVLCSSQGAYVKNAIQKAGIGEDFYSSVDEFIKCPTFGFVSAGCRESDKEAFTKTITDTLREVSEKGIDKERLLSAIRMLEFNEKEDADTWKTKGISFAIQMLPKLLYSEDDPLELLEFFDGIDKLKELAPTDYFENFIREHFLNNAHQTLVTLYPDTEFTAREDNLLSEKCRVNAAKEDFADLVSDWHLLNAYRSSEDDAETAEKIPILTREDLSPETDDQDSVHVPISGGELLWQDRQTNSIAYLDWYFDLRTLDKALLPYYRIFTELFGAMDTKSHGYAAFSDLIDSYTGGISHVLNTPNAEPSGGEMVPYMDWHCRFLYENADKAFDLNREMLLETDFSDTDRIHDMLLQLRVGYERDLLDASHVAARGIGLSAWMSEYAWGDTLQGYTFFGFLRELLDHFDERKQELVAAMENIRASLFRRASWKFSYVGDESFLDKAKEMTEHFAALLDRTDLPDGKADVPLQAKSRAAYCSPSQVQYAALCGMMPRETQKLRGYFAVLEHLLNTDYLWQNVRVLGGAYGVSAGFGRSGSAVMVSYRDPNLDETYNVYRRVIDYIRSLDMTERDFRQYVIGALNRLDRPHPAYVKGLGQIQRELCGVTKEDSALLRQQIIGATTEDIKALVPYLEAWLDTAVETVIGSEQKIKASAVAFDNVTNLL